jgi:hypothetical protein
MFRLDKKTKITAAVNKRFSDVFFNIINYVTMSKFLMIFYILTGFLPIIIMLNYTNMSYIQLLEIYYIYHIFFLIPTLYLVLQYNKENSSDPWIISTNGTTNIRNWGATKIYYDISVGFLYPLFFFGYCLLSRYLRLGLNYNLFVVLTNIYLIL